MNDQPIIDTIAAALNGRPDDYRLGADLRIPAERVIAALTAELGLREESEDIPEWVGRVECTCIHAQLIVGDFHEPGCPYQRGHVEFITKHRYVTDWQADQ